MEASGTLEEFPGGVVDELNNQDRKLCKVDEGVYLACAGLSADGRVLVSKIRMECQSYRYGLRVPPSVQYIAKYVGGLQHRCTRQGGSRPFGVSCLIVGFDGDGKPRLFRTEPSGLFAEWTACAVGKGSEKALAALEAEVETGTNARFEEDGASASQDGTSGDGSDNGRGTDHAAGLESLDWRGVAQKAAWAALEKGTSGECEVLILQRLPRQPRGRGNGIEAVVNEPQAQVEAGLARDGSGVDSWGAVRPRDGLEGLRWQRVPMEGDAAAVRMVRLAAVLDESGEVAFAEKAEAGGFLPRATPRASAGTEAAGGSAG